MEVAGRIFDALFNQRLSDAVQDQIGRQFSERNKPSLRDAVRVGALLHDVGHLPFSHAAEKELLPPGWNHERMTAEIIRGADIRTLCEQGDRSIRVTDVVDAACDIGGRAKYELDASLPAWKNLLNQIITGDIFGADRIDYLLRDAWHTGVPYGRFDHDLLIEGLRVVINPHNGQVDLGVDIGAIHAAEALLIARYFMYTQVYFHKTRRIYNIHLQEFLQKWLEGGRFSTDYNKHLEMTDNEVLSAINQAAQDPGSDLHVLALRLVGRRHFRAVYTLLPSHKRAVPTILEDIGNLIKAEFQEENVKVDSYTPGSGSNDFWVLTQTGKVESGPTLSTIAQNTSLDEMGFVFVEPSLKEAAKQRVDAEFKQALS
jgi:HD superfamily phosphohydrolase